MRAILFSLFTALCFAAPNLASGQLTPAEPTSTNTDTVVVKTQHSYKTAEIAYEIERASRDIKDATKKIKAYENTQKIDTSFALLNTLIKTEFEEFDSYNIQNLSKSFLINTKRVWSNYRAQLDDWQNELSGRLQDLMEISDKIKKRESLWVETSKNSATDFLPDEINNRINTTIDNLQELEKSLYEAVEKIAVLDSKIIDQMIDLDQYIETIEELHKQYRASLFKATQTVIWKTKLKETFDGTVTERMKKALHENLKSMKDSLPIFMGHINEFITWIIIILIVIFGLRYFYIKQKKPNNKSDEQDIKELIIDHTAASIMYLVLFTFYLLFDNIPIVLSGVLALSMLVITYFLLRRYINVQGQRLILIFIPLLIANLGEIVFWYFGNYARLYLAFEAALGVGLILYFMTPAFARKINPTFRYKLIVNLLRYPIFFLYTAAFIVNLFGFQNLTVFFLRVGTHTSYAIIIILGAWEITASAIHLLFQVLTRFEKHKSYEYFPILRKRLNLFVSFLFSLVGFHIFLVTLEIDTLFYSSLDQFMTIERQVGSFIFTWGAIYQFLIIMLVTWGLVTIIKISLNDGNFKRTQRLRGVPAAISITLRMLVAIGGFLFALSAAGIDLTKISIMLGAFSVGIGFGLQNIVNNFISGLILIYERPIQVGDTIEINTLMGEVKKIGIRSSKVRTYDGAEVVVPNSILVSDQLINWTLSDNRRRLEIIIGVKYGSDPEEVIRILKETASSHELVAKFPEPMVLFNEFADSSLNFRLLFWVLFEQGIQVKSDVSVAIDKAFKEANIEIPFPQLDLHVLDVPNHEDRATDSPRETTSES
ncbi:mechanosensitive ion channel family protein [Mangrovibacterium diazotrophicum]|uniref:Mechanosensitive ion channel-like protein n=1 Tax=Mangrovibacterium diazotrophicum TaxID=1261403 RepID=A0A419W9Y1_9BACT|nr:mechanosensitive ion channel domain-containing protein [Mangrovibacterium diazotrophicum]RKD92278.1 mechanosensitive ion channel-like protein [Mangrovibacterium diazotrophicum]